MFNIGINGSMYVGALYAGWAGYKFTSLGHIPHVSLCIAIAIITGSLWMLLPALLKVYAGVSEIISTIILNFEKSSSIYIHNHLKFDIFKLFFK